EGAVPLLDEHLVRGVALQFRQQLAAVRAGDGDAVVLPPRPEEGVAQVRGEFLADPNDRLPGLAEGRGKAVYRRRQLIALRRQGGLRTEIVVQQVDDEQQVFRRLHRTPRFRRTTKLTYRGPLHNLGGSENQYGGPVR